MIWCKKDHQTRNHQIFMQFSFHFAMFHRFIRPVLIVPRMRSAILMPPTHPPASSVETPETNPTGQKKLAFPFGISSGFGPQNCSVGKLMKRLPKRAYPPQVTLILITHRNQLPRDCKINCIIFRILLHRGLYGRLWVPLFGLTKNGKNWNCFAVTTHSQPCRKSALGAWHAIGIFKTFQGSQASGVGESKFTAEGL